MEGERERRDRESSGRKNGGRKERREKKSLQGHDGQSNVCR